MEASRQWSMVFGEWIIMISGLQRISGVYQLFLKRNEDGTIKLLIVKVTDYILVVGTRQEQEVFNTTLRRRFPIRKSIIY